MIVMGSITWQSLVMFKLGFQCEWLARGKIPNKESQGDTIAKDWQVWQKPVKMLQQLVIL
jgi:hypothetical protein